MSHALVTRYVIEDIAEYPVSTTRLVLTSVFVAAWGNAIAGDVTTGGTQDVEASTDRYARLEAESPNGS